MTSGNDIARRSTCSPSLNGQRVLVTGASSGIGEGIARAFAAAGAKVIINYVGGEDKAKQIANEIQLAGGEAYAIHADVSQENDVLAMFDKARELLGSIDILINNAGLQRDAAFKDLSLADWNTVIGVNLTGQFLCAREAVREFFRRGPLPDISPALGKIICMSSVHEVIPWAGHANYAASKGGIYMLMKTMAQELAQYKIRVNAIAPGAIKTPINTAAWATPEAEAQLLKLIPYYRVGNVDDIAKAALWLASDDSDYVTGTTLFVDGGMSLYPEFREGG